MPTIALPTVQPIADLPATVKNRERGPVVDYSGEIRQIGQNAQLSQGSLVNPDALSGSYEGLDAIGRAIAKAGSELGAIAAERDEAQTRTQLYEADTAMHVASLDFEKRKVGMDPSQWGPEFSKTIQAARDAWSQNPNLTNAARQAGALKWERFILTGTKGMEEAATVKMFADAKNAGAGEMEIATLLQDSDRFHAASESFSKYFTKEEIESRNLNFALEGERQAERRKADEVRARDTEELARALAQPDQYIEEFKEWDKDNKDADPSERLSKERAVDAANGAIRQRNSTQAYDLEESIADGSLKMPEEIDAEAKKRNINARLVMQAKASLFKKQAFDAELDRKQNASANYGKMWGAVEAYDASKDPERVKAFELMGELRDKVGAEDDGYLRQKLYGKMTGSIQKLDAPKQAYGLVDDILKTKFNARTGPLPWEIAKVDERGREVKNKQGSTVFTEDTGKHIEALTIQADIQRKMYEWLKQNPEEAKDAQKVRHRTLEVMSETGAIRSIQQVLQPQASAGSANQGRITSYGYANDETPDSNSSAGIGAFVPMAEQQKIRRGEYSSYKLGKGDFAVSPDIERQFVAQGIEPGDHVILKLADGKQRLARWMDRTAQDEDVAAGRIKGVTKPLRGRFDFYSPSGKDEQEGQRVVGWSKVS